MTHFIDLFTLTPPSHLDLINTVTFVWTISLFPGWDELISWLPG